MHRLLDGDCRMEEDEGRKGRFSISSLSGSWESVFLYPLFICFSIPSFLSLRFGLVAVL